MAKVNIDLEKLICALMKRYYLIHNIDRSQVKCWLDDVLEDCGIKYKDGSLHYIGEEEGKKAVKKVCEDIVGESEPSTIKRGKWYKLIKPIGGFSTIGKIYYACYDRHLLVDDGMVCNVEEVSDHFQLVTQVEIKEVEKPATIKFEEEIPQTLEEISKKGYVDMGRPVEFVIQKEPNNIYTESELCRMSPYELCKILEGHSDRIKIGDDYADLIDDKKTYRMYRFPRLFGTIGYDVVQFETGKKPYLSLSLCFGKDPFFDDNNDKFTRIVHNEYRESLLKVLIDGILKRQIKKKE